MQTVMTFEEILQEGVDDGSSSNPPDVVVPTMTSASSVPPTSSSSNFNGPLGQIPEPTEPSIYDALKKPQKRVLSEALYHSAENGFVDITIDPRNMGEELC